LDAGQWVAFIAGISPGATLDQETLFGQNLFHSAGLNDQNVAVTQALDLTGAFLLKTPPEVTQQTLSAELHQVPGFIFVQGYTPDSGNGNHNNNGGINGDFIDGDGYTQTFGGEFDYQAFLTAQKSGLVTSPAGPVTTPPGTTDVLADNNLGSSGTSGFTHSETTTVAFGTTVLVGFNDSGEHNLAGNNFTGWSRSTDGGLTFTDGGPLPMSPNGDAGDPVLARSSATGRVFFATLEASGSGIAVFHSDDGGATWSAGVEGAPGKSGLQDKEWITVDNSTAAGSGYGNVYLAERDFGGGAGIYFFRSTDNGATFGPSGGTLIVTDSVCQGAFVTVSPDHSVEVFYFDGSTIQMRKSTDQGATFGAPVTVYSGLVGGINGDLGLTGVRQGTTSASGFRSNEFPHAAVNPVNGNIYVTFDNKGTGSDKADVFLVQSTDGGATWTTPLKVNDDTTNTDQWQPTIAVTPDGSKLGIFYYSREIDTTNDNLFEYWGRVATISGSTLTFMPSFAVSDTPSLPEFGRDTLVNFVYMGDYNTAYATAGEFYVSWSDNRFDLPNGSPRKEPDVFFKSINLGLEVVSTTPAAGSIVSTQPTVFTVNVTDPVDPATLAASAFVVNGIPADSVSYTPGTTTLTFTFNTTPVTNQGLQTMHIDAGALTRASDGGPIDQFDATFRYDAVLLQVTSTNPPANGVFSIPGPLTYDLNFNEAVDPISVQTTSIALAGLPGAFISSVTVLPGNTTARFTIGGVTSGGVFTVSLAAGAITDAFGNPGAAFNATYTVHFNLFPLPTPMNPLRPLGSLIYDPTEVGAVSTANPSDSFTLPLTAGQTLALRVTPIGGTLQPVAQLFDPNNNLVATATSPAAGQAVLLDAALASVTGTYKIVVSGSAGSTGGYAVQTILDSAVEEARFGGPPDTSRAMAQSIEPSFVHLSASDAGPQRAAILGQTQQTTGGYFATAVTPTFDDISATGTRTLQGVDDGYVSVGPSQLGSFTFTFYGHNYTTVYFSSNGLISFGSGDSTLSTSDLTSPPPEACIAVFLEDLYVTGASDSAVLWQVLGTGATQRLVIQWNDISFYRDSSRTGGLTFEAELYANGAIQLNYQTLSTSHTADEGLRSTVGVKDAGTQGPNRLLLDNQGTPATYSQYVGSNLSTLITQVAPTSEFYAFHLNAGDSATLAVGSLPPGRNITEELQDAAGNVLAQGRTGPTNVGAVINDFVAPSSGTYYVRVNGDSLTIYSLVVTRNADFATKPNADFQSGQAQPLLSTATASGQTVLGYIAGSELNSYQVQALAGGTLTIQTQTPLDDPAGPVGNPLVPIVYLYDPSGNLVATSSRSAGDGKNVLLSYPVPAGAGGYYFVQIGSADGSSGEYVLTVAGATGAEPDFAVASTNPANHASLQTVPTQFTVTFNNSLLLTSVTAGALTIDGQAATGFTILSPTTVQFTLPTLSAGPHTVNLDSIILDVHGRPLDAYQGDFSFDNLGPRIIGSSIQESDALSSGTIDYVVTFNKQLDASHLNNADFMLHGTVRGSNLTPASFTYDPAASVLTLHYVNVPSDQYTLTLVSGANNIVDLAGNPLDGAPHWPTHIDPAHPSGTGNPGSAGNFFVDFSDQSLTAAYPTTFTQLRPGSGLFYQGQAVTDMVVSATDTPFYTLAVNAGETVTVLVTTTSGTFRAAVTLFDASMTVVGTASASAAGQPALLQAVHVAGAPETSQVYTIEVSGVGGTVGSYTVQVTLDAGLEASLYGGPSDTSRATAQDLTPLFAPLPKGASVAAVAGQTPPTSGYTGAVVTPTFENVSATRTRTLQGVDDGYASVGPAQLGSLTFPFFGTTYSTIYFSSNGLISFGNGDSAYSNTDLTTSPTEACIAVLWQDLVVTGATDSGVYWQVVGSGTSQHLVIQWQDVRLYSGTGVFTFEAVLNLDGSMQFNYGDLTNANQGTGATVGIKAAGPQGPNRLLLSYRGSGPQYIGSNKSTLISPVAPGSEYYAFPLTAGQHVSLAAAALASGQVMEELQDSAGNVLATGTAFASGAGQAINNFIAPATGTYYIRISGATQVNYDLAVTRNAVLDLGGNGTQATAQDMDGTAGALGYLATGSTVEWYHFTAAAGQNLSLASYTPGAGGGVFVNTLAPHIQLYNAGGTLVASGVVGPDGHNEQITYTVPSGAGGTYYLRIASANGQPGEFFLDPEETPAILPPVAGLVPPPAAVAPLANDGPVWQGTPGTTRTLALDRVFAADAWAWQEWYTRPRSHQAGNLADPLQTGGDPLSVI
jgi:hypothetical protein